MRIDIHDMFDGYIDDSGITLEMEKENIDMQKIRNTTMAKAASEHKPRMKKPVRIILAAAIITVLLTGVVSAAALGIASFRYNLGQTEYSWVNSENIEDSGSYDVGLEINLPARENVRHEIGFTVGYLPETEDDTETSDYTLSGPGKIYHQIVHSDYDCTYALSMMTCNPAPFDKSYILMGTAETIREDVINGRNAQFITVDKNNEDDFLYPHTRAIILTDEATGAVLVIHGTYSFDELERIAQDVDILESSQSAYIENDNFGGVVGEFCMG